MLFADEVMSQELVFADGPVNVGNRSQQSKVAALTRWKKAAVEKALRTLDVAASALAVCTGQARMRGCAFKANALKKKTLLNVSMSLVKASSRAAAHKKILAGRRRGKSWALNSDTQMDMAVDFATGTVSKRSMAKAFTVEKTAVMRSIANVASFSMNADVVRLTDLRRFVAETSPVLDFGLLTIAGDTTRANFAVSLPGSAHANASKPSKSLLTLVVLAWREKGETMQVWNVEMPPLECISDDAATMWRMLHTTPVGQALFALWRAIDFRVKACGHQCFLQLPSDDAKANGRLAEAFSSYHAGTSVTVDRQKCMNHQTQLAVVETVVSIFGLAFTASLYHLSGFFAMSTYFLRCQLALRGFIESADFNSIFVQDHAQTTVERDFCQALTLYAQRRCGIQQRTALQHVLSAWLFRVIMCTSRVFFRFLTNKTANIIKACF
jgi:hypothetical protein